MKKLKPIQKILKDKELRTKIFLYMSSISHGDDYDEYENNVTYDNLNPITVIGYVRELTPEAAFYKQYGLHQSGTKEILCDSRFRNAFENCNKIEIDSIEYQTFKDANNKTLITARPYNIIRVVVVRKN